MTVGSDGSSRRSRLDRQPTSLHASRRPAHRASPLSLRPRVIHVTLPTIGPPTPLNNTHQPNAHDYPHSSHRAIRVGRVVMRSEAPDPQCRRGRRRAEVQTWETRFTNTSLCSCRAVRRPVAVVLVDLIRRRQLLPIAVATALLVQRLGDVVQGDRQLFKGALEHLGLARLHREP